MRHKYEYGSRLLLISVRLCLLVLLLVEGGHEAGERQADKKVIQYTVVSQRWLSYEELSKFEDVKGYKIAIRVRLSNETDRDIEYLASSLDIRPLGYSWTRKIGKKDWEYTPSRNLPPSSMFTGIGYTWRVLPSHSAIETEILSYTAKDEEFAFSTLIRKDLQSQMQEVVSNVIRPLVNR